MRKYLITICIISCFLSCNHQKTEPAEQNIIPKPKGTLFIIGGGYKPPEMIKELIKLSEPDSADYIVILPMSASEIDTTSFYSIKQFTDAGAEKVFSMNFAGKSDYTQQRIDSVANAKLIYISGGDQNKFMESVIGTELYDAIHKAYFSGSTIAGTSAGAAVMSKKMISGNQLKQDEYTGYFRTIEANNIEIKEGIGLLEHIIIDQHFIKRMRMNRLISVCLENPESESIGIDESTAIHVFGDSAVVYGLSQVIVLKHTETETKVINGIMGAKGISMDIYLPGDTFNINN